VSSTAHILVVHKYYQQVGVGTLQAVEVYRYYNLAAGVEGASHRMCFVVAEAIVADCDMNYYTHTVALSARED